MPKKSLKVNYSGIATVCSVSPLTINFLFSTLVSVLSELKDVTVKLNFKFGVLRIKNSQISFLNAQTQDDIASITSRVTHKSHFSHKNGTRTTGLNSPVNEKVLPNLNDTLS